MKLFTYALIIGSIVNAFYFNHFASKIIRKHLTITCLCNNDRPKTFYPLSKIYHEQYLKRLITKNITDYINHPILHNIHKKRKYSNNYTNNDLDDNDEDGDDLDDEDAEDLDDSDLEMDATGLRVALGKAG